MDIGHGHWTFTSTLTAIVQAVHSFVAVFFLRVSIFVFFYESVRERSQKEEARDAHELAHEAMLVENAVHRMLRLLSGRQCLE